MNITIFTAPLLRRVVFFVLAFLLICAPVQAVQSAAREWNEELMAAIRRNVPNPPAHARNLHHEAVAMYDAWAAYDTTAVGYIYNEKVAPLPGTPAAIEAARHEAISYAAYRVMWARFVTPVPAPAGMAATYAGMKARMTALGYSFATAEAAITVGTTPAEVGKRIGQAILTWGATDGFSQTAYPQAYNDTINPNMLVVSGVSVRAISVLGNNGESPSRPNMP